MSNFRIIPRLEVKNTQLLKGIRIEDHRIVGNPIDIAIQYYEEEAVENFYSDNFLTFAGGSGKYIRELIY